MCWCRLRRHKLMDLLLCFSLRILCKTIRAYTISSDKFHNLQWVSIFHLRRPIYMFRLPHSRHERGCIQKNINTICSVHDMEVYIFNTFGYICIYLYVSSLMMTGTGRNMWKRYYKWQIIAYYWFGFFTLNVMNL